ncbi:hypothetical protein [Actinomadura oligospora]|uniref:hypothetical protein n=1 Tax=Actinomadura oligospora TaxID=111804 RepID=UPI0004786A9B|nr:hypothetical protein [Actinomadura oligospora]
MVKVEIFHNVAKDSAGRSLGVFGFEPGQPVVKVFEYKVDGVPPTEPVGYEELAEDAYCLGNGIAHLQSELYYARKMRSVSVGDLIRINQVWVAVDKVGFWFPAAKWVNDITAKFEGQHGTQPWKESA